MSVPSEKGPGYHQRVAAQKREAIVGAATTLFTTHGFARVSLAQVAAEAGVSRATLFKQFPTKADLFDAVIRHAWRLDAGDGAALPVGRPREALASLGATYAELVGTDRMAGLFRLVIAESVNFPELSKRHFDLGKMPFFEQVATYLERAHAQGSLVVPAPTSAATQFLGMIASYVLWPRLLLPDWAPTLGDVHREVEAAVETMMAGLAA